MCGCAQWRSHSKTTKRKAQPLNPSHPRSQPSQTIAEGSKTLVAALRKSVSGRQRPICPMVKEAVRDLDAAKLAECSGRLAPGWLASAKDWSANKAKNSQRRKAGSSRSWRSECLRRLRPWRRVRQRWLPWRRSVEQAKQTFQRQVLHKLRGSPHPTPSLQSCTAWPQSRLLSRKEIPRAVGWTSAGG